MTSVSDFLEQLHPERPLLLLDADEVLLRFVETLEQYLLNQGAELRLNSFQLGGNIFNKSTGKTAPPNKVKEYIAGFFDACVDQVPVIEGAADALDRLREHYEIVVFSNVPAHCRARREASLKDQGIDFPVIANRGEKGPGVKTLSLGTSGHTVFIDDLPPQLASVANHAPDIHRVHFVGDPRLAQLIDKAPEAHIRIDEWPGLEHHLKGLMKTDMD